MMRVFCLIYLFIHSLTLQANEVIPSVKITKIQQNIYLHKSYNDVKGFGLVSSNGLIVIEDDKAFIVDTPWSEKDTEILVNWIKDKHYHLLGSVSTHSHDDRTAGIAWMKRQKIPTYATALTNEILNKAGKTQAQHNLEAVESTLADGMIKTYYPGEGHAVDNIVVWLPKSKILFGGCLVRSMASKSLGYTGEANIDQWGSSVEKIQKKFSDAEYVIPGHGRVGDIELLQHTKLLVNKQLLKIE